MKAWHVYDGEPGQSDLLVFAETRSRARKMAKDIGLWEYEDWICIRAKRCQEFDQFFEDERVVDTNDDLPPDAPRFYADEV